MAGIVHQSVTAVCLQQILATTAGRQHGNAGELVLDTQVQALTVSHSRHCY